MSASRCVDVVDARSIVHHSVPVCCTAALPHCRQLRRGASPPPRLCRARETRPPPLPTTGLSLIASLTSRRHRRTCFTRWGGRWSRAFWTASTAQSSRTDRRLRERPTRWRCALSPASRSRVTAAVATRWPCRGVAGRWHWCFARARAAHSRGAVHAHHRCIQRRALQRACVVLGGVQRKHV
jgi:hypothetical protein